MIVIPKDIIAETVKLGSKLAGPQLTVDLARLYSQKTRIMSGQPGLGTWQQEESIRNLHDAESLIEAAILHRSQGLESWRRYYQRAAEILEWLSNAKAFPPEYPVSLLSAATYQLAGYPARAHGVINELTDDVPYSRILRAFLKGDFKLLQIEIARYWRTNSIENGRLENISVEDLIIKETISALGVLSSYIRWGDSGRLEKAINKLGIVEKVLLNSRHPYSWLLSRMISEIAKDYYYAAIRTNLVKLQSQVTQDGVKAIERYSRLAYIDGTSLVWLSQLVGIRKIEANTSFALCTPTGSGKTRIAELAIIQALFGKYISNEVPIILYLVPSKALAAEVEIKMSRTLRHIGEEQVTVTSLYGGTDWGPSDSFLSLTRPLVIVATHEKAEALVRFLGATFIDRIKLVVIDEAHGVEYIGDGENLKTGRNRSLHLEMFVSRLSARLESSNCKFIALSAVAAGIESDIAHWTARDSGVDAVTTDYRSTRQLVGRLICRPNRSSEIRYDVLDGQHLAVKSNHDDESPYIPAPFPSHPPATYLENGGVEKKLRPYLFWAAMHMAARDNLGDYHSVLISVPQQPGGYAEDMLLLLDEMWKEKTPDFFDEKNTNDKYVRCLTVCEDYFGKDSREYRLLLHGVVLHHGKMPGIMSRLLIDLIQNRTINIVIATSTLTEGINLPFEVVLIPTLRREGGYLSSRELSNLIGRAGRPGISTEGRSLVLMDQSMTSGTANAYLEAIKVMANATSSQVTPLIDRGPLAKLLIYIYRKFKETNSDISNKEFISWLESTICENSLQELDDGTTALDTLDGIILEAIQEAEDPLQEAVLSGLQVEDILLRLWRNTFSYYSATHKEALGTILKVRGKSLIEKIYPSRQNRQKLYKTSLPPRDGKILISMLEDVRNVLESGKQYWIWSSSERTKYVARLITVINSIPSFAIDSKSKIGEKWPQVLHWWLNPTDVSIKPNPKKISAWYEYSAQNFAYRFNWGLGAIFGSLFPDGFMNKNAFDSWADSSLPWAVFWIKDMVTWGLLDPVATYLIMNKYAETRAEAISLASRYYDQVKSIKDDRIFDPRTIATIASDLFPANKAKSADQPQGAIKLPVHLVDKVERYLGLNYSVWPALSDDKIRWIDPSGYDLATSDLTTEWKSFNLTEYDFILRPNKSDVLIRKYF